MENKKKINKLNYFKNLGLLFYLVVLAGERIASIVLSFIDKSIFTASTSTFNNYVHMMSIIAIAFTIIILNKQFIYMIRCLFKFDNNYQKLDFSKIVLSSGILLIAGMLHTNHTCLFGQFVAYAGLIVSMLMVALDENKIKENRFIIWSSFAYLVCFAMAIPVAYSVSSDNANQKFLEYYQCFGSFLLVSIFTYLLMRFYSDKSAIKINPLSLAVLLAIDLPILLLLYEEKGINFFIFIFPILSIIAYGFYIVNKFKGVNKSK